MNVEVKLFATLQPGRFRRKRLEFPEGSTATDVCRRLAIHPSEVAILTINGKAADRTRSLAPGDVLSLFPAIGGG